MLPNFTQRATYCWRLLVCDGWLKLSDSVQFTKEIHKPLHREHPQKTYPKSSKQKWIIFSYRFGFLFQFSIMFYPFLPFRFSLSTPFFYHLLPLLSPFFPPFGTVPNRPTELLPVSTPSPRLPGAAATRPPHWAAAPPSPAAARGPRSARARRDLMSGAGDAVSGGFGEEIQRTKLYI